MDNRSHEEITYHLEWLQRLGCLSLENIVNALNKGDECGMIDACFVDLPGVPNHASEYDGGFFHQKERLNCDIKKTKKMLQHDDWFVCRVRVAAPHLPLQDSRLVVVYVEKPRDAVDAMAAAFFGRVGNAIATSVAKPSSKEALANIKHDLYMLADAQYKEQHRLLAELVGDCQSRAMLRVHGISSRLHTGSVVRALDKLRLPPYSVKLQTFMCGGVAARLDDEASLFLTLDKLRLPPYSVKLQTFMCDGVAARLDDEAFIREIEFMPKKTRREAIKMCKLHPMKKKQRVC